jgi:hypothetical protein
LIASSGLMPDSPKPPPLDPCDAKAATARRERAWIVAIANQLALPGFGTVMAGRRTGYVQLAFSATGVLCFTVFLIYALPRLGTLLNALAHPSDDPEVALNFLRQWLPWLLVALTGIALWVIAWLWALGTSVKVVRDKDRPASL